MHRHTITLSLAAIAALMPAGALAQPMQDAAAPDKARAHAVHRHHGPGATRPSKISPQQRTSIRKWSGKDCGWRFCHRI